MEGDMGDGFSVKLLIEGLFSILDFPSDYMIVVVFQERAGT